MTVLQVVVKSVHTLPFSYTVILFKNSTSYINLVQPSSTTQAHHLPAKTIQILPLCAQLAGLHVSLCQHANSNLPVRPYARRSKRQQRQSAAAA
jgi:hypothetical protein